MLNKTVIKWLSISFLAILSLVAVKYGVYYCLDFWAPSSYEGGLEFKERPSVCNYKGESLSHEDTDKFLEICRSLESTTRDIHEDRGSGYVRMSYSNAEDSDFITVYYDKNVIFFGWWIDAKTHAMAGRRAPCYLLNDRMRDFLSNHMLVNPDA